MVIRALLILLLLLFVASPPSLLAGNTPSPPSGDQKVSPSEKEFCRLDKNNDREISYEEFSACQFYRLERVKRLPFVDLDRFPKDASGRASEEDLKRYLFERADKNKDSRIGRKEWEEFYDSVTVPY